MKQIVNSPEQQFYSFDDYIRDNNLSDTFTPSKEFESFNSDLWAEYDNYEYGLDNDDYYETEAYARNGYMNAGGRRKKCRAKGLKGKALNQCAKELRMAEKKTKEGQDKRKTNRRIVARILTGGLSGLGESKEQRKKTTQKMLKDTKNAGEGVWKGIKRSIFGVPFLAYIGAVRANVFGQAPALYPALLTEREAREKGFSIPNWKKSKKLLARAEKDMRKMAAATDKDIKMFHDAIKKGWNKPPFRSKKKAHTDNIKRAEAAAKGKKELAAEDAAKAKTNSPEQSSDKKKALLASFKEKHQAGANNFSNFDYYDPEWFNDGGVISIPAIIVAAGSIIGVVADMIKKEGVSKNPYEPGKTPPGFDAYGDDEPASMPATEKQQSEMIASMIETDPNFTEQEKKEMLAQVPAAVGYMNKTAKEETGIQTDDILLYGGIAVGAIAVLWIGSKLLTKPTT